VCCLGPREERGIYAGPPDPLGLCKVVGALTTVHANLEEVILRTGRGTHQGRRPSKSGDSWNADQSYIYSAGLCDSCGRLWERSLSGSGSSLTGCWEENSSGYDHRWGVDVLGEYAMR
jgi:hypothetical protein